MNIKATYSEWKGNLKRDSRPLERGARRASTIGALIALMAFAISNEEPLGYVIGLIFLSTVNFFYWPKVSCRKPVTQAAFLGVSIVGSIALVFFDNELIPAVLINLFCLWVAIEYKRMKTKQDTARMFGPIIVSTSMALIQSEGVITGLLCITAIGINLIGMAWGAQKTKSKFHLRSATWSVSKVMILVLPIAFSMFFLFPRVPLGFNTSPNDGAGQGMTGMSQTMTPGSVSELAKDKKIAFTVEFKSKIPPESAMYWKATVLDRYNGKSWFSEDYLKQKENQEKKLTIEDVPDDYKWDYEVKLPASMMSFVPILDSTIPNSVAIGMPMPEAYLSRANPAGVTTKKYFDGYSINVNARILGKGLELNSQNLTPPRPQDISLPKEGNEKTRELAKQWADEAQEKGRGVDYIVERFKTKINQEPYEYTLKPKKWGSEGIDQFLFTDQAGFCEHYASAFVFLLRAAGFSSRVVVGYQGAEIDGLKARILSQNAHAWTEVWYEGEGWKRVDPTSFVDPSRVEADVEENINSKSDIFMRLSAWSEIASNYWNESIVFYDVMRQKDILEKLFGNPIQRIQRLGMIALVLLAGIFGWKKLRHMRIERMPFEEKSEIIYQDILVSCRKLGIQVKATWSPNELIASIKSSKTLNETEDLIEKIEKYERARYST